MLLLGSVHMPGSTHEEALCQAARDKKAIPPAGPLQLYAHQAEDVVCMEAIEKQRAWPGVGGQEMVTNVGILAEPPGSGKAVTMIAHLASSPRPDPTGPFVKAYDSLKMAPSKGVRLRGKNVLDIGLEEEQYVPPSYLPLSVVVASHANAGLWASLASTALRALSVTTQSDLDEFDRALDTLSDEYDVVVVSVSHAAQLAARLRYVRVSRLIIDDPLSISGCRFEIASCFLWFIEGEPERLLGYGSMPATVRDALGPLCLSALRDASPIFVMHSKDEVDISLQTEYPLHLIYHIREQDMPPPAVVNIPLPKKDAVGEQLVIREHVPVWRRDMAPGLVEPHVRARLEEGLSSEDGCLVCTEAWKVGEGVCLLTCCTRLLCCTCTWKIMHTSGSCPTCRKDVANRGGAVVMISDRLDVPLNVSHYFCPHVPDSIGGLVFILGRIGLGGRVLIYLDCEDHWVPGTDIRLEEFLQAQLSLQLLYFSGNGRKQRVRLAEYQGSPATGVSLLSPRMGVVLSNHHMARGLNLDATTDVVFFSAPTQHNYEEVLSRVINAGTPRVTRKNGRRLRVHMLSHNGAFLPNLKFSQKGIGVGRGSEGKTYELQIASDLVTF